MGTTLPTFTVGDRLAKARDTAGISVKDMATQLGVDRKTIGNYEHERCARVPRSVLIAYAQLTGVPLWWLDGNEPDEDTVTLREQWPAIPYSSRAA